METPLIYHLDVSAMYPNIILTNRLQPDAMVEETTCAACDFNEGPNSSCQRRLPWLWRGEYFPASRGEIKMIKNQLQNERFTRKNGNNELEACSFHDLPEAERMSHIKKRVGDYSRKVYKRLHENKVIEKEAIICQRENPFYINTVRSFRDRRYEYKTLHKVWKKKLDDAQAEDDIVAAEESKKMIVVYDSLQLAHKCILNSFYGYVMRKGARWYSMEMAGIVCLTGSTIIQLARSRIEQLGTPLELDTDGIWCILPSSFPETFKFELSNGKTYNISYPCVMLNHLVHARFTNHQYQDRVDPHRNEFSVRSENSIFFEVDGPYKAMILPASLEEDKLLKKRYAVFDHSDKMTELKGFEMKRRGELKMIKEFQTEIFKYFLKGQTLQECYEEVAKVANRWLDILFTKGAKVDDEELFDLISENRSMSKSLAEYGSQKSTSICTAKRLADLLGSQTVKDKGLNCRFVISAKPAGTPVSERAVPVVIFKTEEEEKKRFLRKWLRDTNLNDFDIRSILDWNYYLERFGSVLQKLITIPAAMQGVKNPIERIAHPDWLKKRLTSGNQQKINELFNLRPIKAVDSDKENESSDDGILAEIEDNIPVDRSIKKVAPVPPTISPFQNYSEYLQSAKAYWRTERKRIASMAHSAGPAKRVQLNTHVSDVGQFFRKETSILLQSKWHILQVFETDIPGECRLWVVINNGLYQFKLSVPRVFYVNSSSEEQPVMDRSDIEVTRVNKTLPRGRPVLNLYQFSLPEPVYREHINLFASLFNHPDIDGVYESQVPLLFRALIHMGCVCSVSAKDSLEDGLKFKDISSATKDTASYLKGIVMNHIYVFHTFSGQRQVIGAISIEEGHGALFFSSPGGEEPAVNIQSLYQESYVAYTADSEASFVYPESVDFTTFLFKLESDMVTGFGRWIRDYQDRKRGATLVLLQTPTIANLYLQKFGYLKDFPHLFIPTHQSDVLLPVFGWQSYAVQRMMSHYFNVEPWLRERMELSRYADVPMCNLEIDYPIFLTDLFLARGLQKQEHLLWMSNSDRPDLGGRERDIFPSQLDVGDDSEQNLSGLYTQYCVEFNLMNLAFNTLIQSTTLSQNEQTVQGFNHQAEKITVSSGLIQTADERLSSQTMHIVRTLVKSWWVQAIETGNKYPETMLEHFYRWVRTPKSKLYDPLMYASIHQLMMAVYRRLIAEFQHLGATVIYANFDKIIIQTTKTSAQRAHQYAKYIKDTIAAKPIFHLLTLQEEKIWDVLVWYNHQNFGGYTIDQEELRESGVLCHWTLGKYLPVGCQGTFETTLIQYITQIHDFFTDHRSKSIDSIDKATKSTLQEQFRVFLSTFLNQTIKRELLKSVPKMYREWQKMEAREEEDHPYLFPVLPGSYETLTNPILEFIKYVSMLLSLGGVCERENQLLKRDLLSLIGVGEYSELALFKNPCETFKLKQVICEYCCSTHDLDLTGDLTLLEQEDQVRAQWICAECGSEYDRLSIERQLMTLLKQYLSAWQLQDVVCTKCRMVCETNLSSYCACSGTIKEEMDSTIILRRVTVMANISKFYRLELLEEMSRWVLEQF
jgi:DNA polymerase epsilon subunit 1